MLLFYLCTKPRPLEAVSNAAEMTCAISRMGSITSELKTLMSGQFRIFQMMKTIIQVYEKLNFIFKLKWGTQKEGGGIRGHF